MFDISFPIPPLDISCSTRRPLPPPLHFINSTNLLAVLPGAADMSDAVATNWLDSSTSMRKIRRFSSAKIALRNAELNGLNKNIVLINESRILMESGNLNKALLLLEPVEQNIPALVGIVKDRKAYDSNVRQGKTHLNKNYPPGGYPEGLETLEKRKFFAERLFLATQCIADSKLKNTKLIVTRYMTAMDIHGSETAHFELARYLENLYHSSVKLKEETGGGMSFKGKKRQGGFGDADAVRIDVLSQVILTPIYDSVNHGLCLLRHDVYEYVCSLSDLNFILQVSLLYFSYSLLSPLLSSSLLTFPHLSYPLISAPLYSSLFSSYRRTTACRATRITICATPSPSTPRA